MSDKFIINGNRELSGEIEVRGSKNAAGPCLAAALLTTEPVIIDNLPLIADIKATIEVLESMGVKTEWLSERKLKLQAIEVHPESINLEKVSKTRMSVALFGSLLGRVKEFKISSPGGDVIGLRPITVQLKALEKIGAHIEREGDVYHIWRDELKGKEIILGEFSPTATQALMLAAVLAKGKTVIKGAAAELSVQDTSKMLVSMGANLRWKDSHTVEIEGVEALHGCEHSVEPDNLEAGTFIVIGALTPGRVVVKNINFEYLDMFLHKLEEMGVNFDRNPSTGSGQDQITVFYSPFLKPLKVQALPHPGFPTDLLPIIMPLLTRAQGKSLIHDPLYENRLGYVQELRKMGGDLEIVDPHRAFIFGPKVLEGTSVNSLDVRAGAVLIVAGLMAEGKTVINDVFHIDRGYERIEERLQKLGADIKRISA
ncbi:MAG: UDP-N-acetylglucosamine 1-carboxyvinyltransferase [Candidatus Staskawiczbacteria bacterium RIFCSPHIGHO2_02_FULL_43_16]|uniref:UDP-N-acetylglucosamine 1-carboxyvinyltransferase n=1 Tax=Candidatus Staskawiczbacteria bacterium RIFCSPHIGHO2_01_FULL_41_41 TaxID=1802203 RepID=A0A1G2HTU0_9BACT|nr:MAG: UDP-N-acetylglucosamine 1-carboxyvinyltransferase [Candidatus Staskawiczbacteria bacterium RIFCSPHIGHO2_01_FULL_41_41]OGZ68289.1 MAG: UDP-N-acetylglucosamine 1-carboxyvinyltransferase [Candidatus Staskawiczbacteria bacterium RIFCSPHIGHO2_02_FULL_43_16]OGZ74677.1 MAG: UDP-N-acetylglucosamine 1-carboxyvinyltransferase [Candidatus Staskawiczbacteria bacterium RIFCSPLOWO2_01_FULL_43_17b]